MIHTRIAAIGTELEGLATEILSRPTWEYQLLPVKCDVRGNVRHALPYSHAPP